MQLTATITVNFTEKDIDDIMSAALDGGITYWCGRAEVVGDYLGEYASDQISRKGTLKLYDIEDESEVFELTYDKFVEGLKKYITETGTRCLYGEDNKIDTCEIDGEAADMIVQFALFGELVYG